ncbi:hypothetical protein BGY98DRAFT_623065 [Russula aff. rugulosa BPL654]|nr:hypothetical protein BGY98DRAFT_623065 [Russula aff. rugulosa BPL654]
MPLICSGGFDTCTPNLAGRERLRMDNTDDASPGYFSLTLNNSIRMEATSTRRAGLERLLSRMATRRSSHSIFRMTCPIHSKAEI